MQAGATSSGLGQRADAAVRRVLIVEDDPDVARSLMLLLAEPRIRIDIAADGVEGLRMARELKPDLVLLDVLLPELDGFETLRAFQRDAALRHTQVFYVTSLSQKSAPYECRGVPWFRKPFSEDALIDAVQRSLFPTTPTPPPDREPAEAPEADRYSPPPDATPPRRFVLLVAPPELRQTWRVRLERELGAATAHAEDIDSAAALGRSPLLSAIYASDPVFGMDFVSFVRRLREQKVAAPILRVPDGPA